MRKKSMIPEAATKLLNNNINMKINSNREVIFEGSRGIVHYSEETIRLNTGKYIVAFNGRGLSIRCMNDYDLCIEGFITSIEYIM